MCVHIHVRTVGGDKLILDPRRSWGPVLECRRIGRPLPGVAPGELAQDGAIRILGVIRVLSDRRLLVNVLPTRRKLLSLADDEVNHPPNIAKQPSGSVRSISFAFQAPSLPALLRIALIFHIERRQREKRLLEKLPHFHLLAIELFRAIFSADAVEPMEPACGEISF